MLNVLRMALRLAGWAVLALVALGVVVALAWLPFNLGDAEPRPRAAALQPPAARVADQRNAAYAVQALLAEAGRDPATTGRAVWAAHKAWATLPPAQRGSAAAGHAAQVSQLMGKVVVAPKGAPLECAGKVATCDADWLANADALARQRATYGVLGERCDKLADGAVEFEELLPPGTGFDAPVMSWGPMSDCVCWFRSGAVVALARGQRKEALVQLERADRLQRRLWEGSRTLIGHMVSTRLARNTYQTMAFAALREPLLAEALAPMLAPPLDTRVGARRWLLHEAQFQRAMLDEMTTVAGALVITESPMNLLAADPLARLTHWLGGQGIGLQRERTRQRLDALLQQRLSSLEYAWPAVLAGAAVEHKARQQRSAWAHLHWRNTLGEAVVELAADTGHGPYFARHADHELHREATALVLALQRQRVAPAQRAQAAQKLPGVSDLLKERLSWSADGNTLTVRAWQSEAPGSSYDPRRDAITFTWPS